ncbi:MAG: flagellar motor protein MotB, partial [Pseudobdellovibrio sp.]
MAQKKQTIVIKKIIVQGGGHHGGSWKVALADFMTAMMAFFLVMWLLGQTDDTKKAVSDYFSTPSMI